MTGVQTCALPISHLVKVLENFHQLRITDIIPIESEHQTAIVDVANLDQVMEAAEGMDAIINCSVLRPDRKLAFDVSTLGAYNTMHAALAHKIQRVIHTGPFLAVHGKTTYRSEEHTSELQSLVNLVCRLLLEKKKEKQKQKKKQKN